MLTGEKRNMKVIAILLAIMLLAVPVCLADVTSRGVYTTQSSSLTEWLNTTDSISHNHGYEKYERHTPAGVGADVVVYQNGGEIPAIVEEVVVEARHDFANEETSVFGVVRLNLFQQVKRLVQANQ